MKPGVREFPDYAHTTEQYALQSQAELAVGDTPFVGVCRCPLTRLVNPYRLLPRKQNIPQRFLMIAAPACQTRVKPVRVRSQSSQEERLRRIA